MTGSAGGPITRISDLMEEQEEEEQIGPGERRVAPEGQYRALGMDPWSFPAEDWTHGDYESKEEALEVARKKNLEAAGGEIIDRDHENWGMIPRYFAYDDEGAYIGGDIHMGE